MTKGAGIIGLADWLETPAGRYLLEWERRQIEIQVADIFGFHSLQLGLPQLNGLQANRMPHRWYAFDPVREASEGPFEQSAEASTADAADAAGATRRVATINLQCEFDALPFDSRSLDLVLLPHALELARDPHLALSEVERVLVPEGKVVILGFNPASLWGLRQRVGRLLARIGLHRRDGLYLPTAGEFIAYKRMRDWLRLLSFEVEAGQFGCYRPALRTDKWLSRYAWIEAIGERWWPVFGSVYLLVAVKRVRGMRLVGLVRSQSVAPKAAPAAAIHQRRDVLRRRHHDGVEP
ncbi:class I SAM-dependent methyltransferase [Piscinibacter sakaiensis]|uniref:class I SAM-dependent methyltransferase n=1 Tax=Piscinibacter sakaiensis TaxID=1547922 RepID=UPI003AAAD9B4